MATVRFDREFESEAAAAKWVADYRVKAWGYDPSFLVWQRGDKWLVQVTESSSCD
jgi:hypothetical protein